MLEGKTQQWRQYSRHTGNGSTCLATKKLKLQAVADAAVTNCVYYNGADNRNGRREGGDRIQQIERRNSQNHCRKASLPDVDWVYLV